LNFFQLKIFFSHFCHEILDPDPYWIRIGFQPKMLDPDPDQMNTDPKHWLILKKLSSEKDLEIFLPITPTPILHPVWALQKDTAPAPAVVGQLLRHRDKKKRGVFLLVSWTKQKPPAVGNSAEISPAQVPIARSVDLRLFLLTKTTYWLQQFLRHSQRFPNYFSAPLPIFA
jgi:hypothetical protein